MKWLGVQASVLTVVIQVIAASLILGSCSTVKNFQCNDRCEDMGFYYYKSSGDVCQCKNWLGYEKFDGDEYKLFEGFSLAFIIFSPVMS